MALTQDPTMVVALYNLADLLEERGRIGEAIDRLRQAVEQAPYYADAHFNLAGLPERTGCAAEASKHWAAHVELDPGSEWSRFVRSHRS